MERVTRNAFLYLEPEQGTNVRDFAQCITCRMFVPGKYIDGNDGGRCVIHGSYLDIYPDDSCGFWVPWPTPNGAPVEKVVKDHASELSEGIDGSVNPESSGLVDEKVQCHRCKWSRRQSTFCGYYDNLNRDKPEMNNLNPHIKPNACCNAFTSKTN